MSRYNLCTKTFYFLILSLSTYSTMSFAADAKKGADSFAANCAVCHSIAKPAKNKIGPSLLGIVGRASGDLANFQYSDSMKAAKIVWTPENLQKYITNPSTFIGNNKMGFKGLADAIERADLIEYLSQQH